MNDDQPRLDARRHGVLAAMGITVWQRRDAAEMESPAFDRPLERPLEIRGATETDANPPTPDRTDAPESPVDALDWTVLESRVAACTACELHGSRTQTVFGVGDRSAPLMVIGEAPGAEEDRRGEPFVGRAGQLLDAMLKAIGLPREAVFIANILKCRPPRNRDPRPEEAMACRAFLERQIALVEPRVLLAVGRIAAQNLLQVDTPIGRMRGRTYTYGARELPVVVTYHPAYLLRSPGEKRKAWDDLLVARQLVEGVIEQ